MIIGVFFTPDDPESTEPHETASDLRVESRPQFCVSDPRPEVYQPSSSIIISAPQRSAPPPLVLSIPRAGRLTLGLSAPARMPPPAPPGYIRR
jgi:hypothetical protein